MTFCLVSDSASEGPEYLGSVSLFISSSIMLRGYDVGVDLELSAGFVCDLRIGVLSGAEDDTYLSLETAAIP